MERNRSNSHYPGDCQFLSAIYASMIHAAHCLNPLKKSISACTVSADYLEPLAFTESFESCTDYSISTPFSDREIPFLYSFRLCLWPLHKKMIFSHIYHHIAKKNISNPAASLDAPNVRSTFSHLSPKMNCSLYMRRTISRLTITISGVEAHKLLHTSAVDQRESKNADRISHRFFRQRLSLLRDTMRWFWPLEQQLI